MKRYLIASNRYIGNAELWYNDSGKLLRIDVSKTDMLIDVIDQFKRIAPVSDRHLTTDLEGFASGIVLGEIVISFDQFWTKYNRKINKARCIPMWDKMDSSERLKAFSGIDKYIAFLSKEKGRKILDPENYLKNKTWENEYS